MPMIETINLTKKYGELVALNNLNLTIDEATLTSEREVVLEERRLRTEDTPDGRGFEALAALVWQAHPYRVPVIGWRSDIENWRQEDVEAFHRNWYAVNNALFVICGAFDRDELVGLLNEKIGSIEPREIPRGVVTVQVPASSAHVQPSAWRGSLSSLRTRRLGASPVSFAESSEAT